MNVSSLVLIAALIFSGFAVAQGGGDPTAVAGREIFLTGHRCIACHSNLQTPSGEDVSIGYSWRASMMANAARDPYWRAAVRREITDHPAARAAIEDKCSTCHLPMARTIAVAAGGGGEILSHFVEPPADPAMAALAEDGVSCALCHQIGEQGLGDPRSLNGGFAVDTGRGIAERPIYGPFEVDAGRRRIMHSSTLFTPRPATHLQSPEFCARCHTLFTHALNDRGEEAGQLPEQVPYLEWRHSAYADSRTCQDCHMQPLGEATPISSVLGEPRPGFSPHVFRGGNAFMIRLLDRYRDELGVEALPSEMEAAAERTEAYLRESSARIDVVSAALVDSALEIVVDITSLAGHKLPTAYPSRRAWLYLAVRDREGEAVFESGAVRPDGSIVGNANDEEPLAYEPHFEVIERSDQVQIYEPIMVDHAGRVTTGLLWGVSYVKDNRLLPRGFDKQTAPEAVSVRGAATADADFAAGGDRVRYRVAVDPARGPFTVESELRYQTIGYRWAESLREYDSAETDRFTRYYDESSADSVVTLAVDTSNRSDLEGRR